MAKPWAKAFYNSQEWAAVRTAALIRDGYVCTICGEPADEVHHIRHLTRRNIGDPSISLNLDNLTSLCRGCHIKHHKQERIEGAVRRKYNGCIFDENGYLVRDTENG